MLKSEKNTSFRGVQLLTSTEVSQDTNCPKAGEQRPPLDSTITQNTVEEGSGGSPIGSSFFKEGVCAVLKAQ